MELREDATCLQASFASTTVSHTSAHMGELNAVRMEFPSDVRRKVMGGMGIRR